MRKELSGLKSSLRSIHNWILLLGATFGLGVYLPTLGFLASIVIISGMPHLMLNVLLVGLAVRQLKRDRPTVKAAAEDQWLGSSLILGGLGIFYLYYPAVTPQALSCMIILVGGVLSYAGLSELRRQKIAIALLVLSLHPNLERVTRRIWDTSAPSGTLAKFMAWSGSELLRAIGQPVSVQDQFVSLPAGVVEVAPGCDGFQMSFVISVTAIVLGVLYQASAPATARLIAIGIALALTLNIFRIAVMVLAAVYWGKASFEFWHGTIGGQIFSVILFTIYYYVTQPILNSPKK